MVLVGCTVWVGTTQFTFECDLGWRAFIRLLLLSWWCWYPEWWWGGLARQLFSEPGVGQFFFTHGWHNASRSVTARYVSLGL